MKRWNLKIELKSDFCTATGEGMPGITNTKTALEYGIPYIPAKRIKGCLLEAGREMADNGIVMKNVLDAVFGVTGADRTEGIYVKNAHLFSAPGHLFGGNEEESFQVEDYGQFQKAVQKCGKIQEAFLEEVFTRRRTRTAIEAESGTAQEHMLRTIQTVPAGIIFTAQIEGSLNREEEAVLKLCAKGLRHMGIGITRGLGEVRCVLEEAPIEGCGSGESALDRQKEKGLFEGVSSEEEVTLPYEIYLDSPVMLEGDAGKDGDCLPGSALLGALAGMYIRKYSLGADAHKDEDFSRIFLRDGVQFGYGFLKQGGKEYIPCPKAVATMKDDHSKWFHIGQYGEGRRRAAVHDQIVLEGDRLHVASPKREIHFHHARPEDRGVAHALNDRAEDISIPSGQFFQYIALSKGQTFAGTLRGKAKDIRKLAKCLEENDYHLRLGRSRTAEYGECTIHVKEECCEKIQKGASKSGKSWLMWLLTPMIPIDMEEGGYTAEGKAIAKQISAVLGCGVEIQKIACDSAVFHGYNSKWRLPAISYPALAAGSAFKLTVNRDGGVGADEIEGQRWGAMTGKGCGQVKVELWEAVKEGTVIPASEESAELPAEELEAGGNMFRSILEYRDKTEDTRYSVNELGALQTEKLPPSSAIELLLQILRSQNGKADFYEEIKSQAEKIRMKSKKDSVIKLIEPCKGISYDSMKQYLENAKWKARDRER